MICGRVTQCVVGHTSLVQLHGSHENCEMTEANSDKRGRQPLHPVGKRTGSGEDLGPSPVASSYFLCPKVLSVSICEMG